MSLERKKTARLLLDIGIATSKRQAQRMAEIQCDPNLSDTAISALLLIGMKAGASFDPGDITQDQIKQATKEVIDTMQFLYLALAPTEGNA